MIIIMLLGSFVTSSLGASNAAIVIEPRYKGYQKKRIVQRTQEEINAAIVRQSLIVAIQERNSGKVEHILYETDRDILRYVFDKNDSEFNVGQMRGNSVVLDQAKKTAKIVPLCLGKRFTRLANMALFGAGWYAAYVVGKCQAGDDQSRYVFSLGCSLFIAGMLQGFDIIYNIDGESLQLKAIKIKNTIKEFYNGAFFEDFRHREDDAR
jgi:hypothetical protein